MPAQLDLETLENGVRVLEISLDSVEVWLAISTFLVVVGLVLEYWHEVADLVKRIREQPTFPWKAFLGIVGGALVTIGVAGELALQFRAATIETKIRASSHQIEAALTEKTSSANQAAKAAEATAKSFESQIAASNARATSAEAQVAVAKAASDTAVVKVSEAQARIAEADEAAAEAQKLAAADQLERVKLEAKLAAIKRYSYVATLTFNGMVYTGGDVTMPTEISQAVDGTWFEPTPNHFRPVCEKSALDKDREALTRLPDFPFTYYALAYCLEKQNDPTWRSYAQQAVAIFKETTTIGGHQKSHDDTLGYLQQLLASAPH